MLKNGCCSQCCPLLDRSHSVDCWVACRSIRIFQCCAVCCIASSSQPRCQLPCDLDDSDTTVPSYYRAALLNGTTQSRFKFATEHTSSRQHISTNTCHPYCLDCKLVRLFSRKEHGQGKSCFNIEQVECKITFIQAYHDTNISLPPLGLDLIMRRCLCKRVKSPGNKTVFLICIYSIPTRQNRLS